MKSNEVEELINNFIKSLNNLLNNNKDYITDLVLNDLKYFIKHNNEMIQYTNILDNYENSLELRGTNLKDVIELLSNIHKYRNKFNITDCIDSYFKFIDIFSYLNELLFSINKKNINLTKNFKNDYNNFLKFYNHKNFHLSCLAPYFDEKE